MTKYTVSIKGEGDATSRDTQDLDDALDWFTNACTEVMAHDGDLELATLHVDGVLCGIIQNDGIESGPETGEVVDLPRARRAANG